MSNIKTRSARGGGIPSTKVAKQIADRNFLQPSGFKFQISRAPKVTYFGNAINIPAIELRTTYQPTAGLKDIPQPGEILDFEDLSLRFLVDENLENYLEIQNWMRGLGFPESLDQIHSLQDTDDDQNMATPIPDGMNIYSDATLTILDSLNNPNFKLVFQDLFPYSLSTLQFDATLDSTEYLMAEVSFKYTIYDIRSIGY
jgi:hypothetical protein|tara:strand:+ start:344 stop:943 length:600 start_codon:yes stop_codon:yes gene_type:complete